MEDWSLGRGDGLLVLQPVSLTAYFFHPGSILTALPGARRPPAHKVRNAAPTWRDAGVQVEVLRWGSASHLSEAAFPAPAASLGCVWSHLRKKSLAQKQHRSWRSKQNTGRPSNTPPDPVLGSPPPGFSCSRAFSSVRTLLSPPGPAAA